MRLDLPMIVGPLPYAAGVELELAYLRAIAAADPAQRPAYPQPRRDRGRPRPGPRRGAAAPRRGAARAPGAAPRSAAGARRDGSDAAALATLLRARAHRRARSLERGRGRRRRARRARRRRPSRQPRAAALGLPALWPASGVAGESPFWARLLEAAGTDGVALVHYHAGPLKSYRLTPRIDAFLKDRLLRGARAARLGRRRRRHAGLGGHRL